MDLQELRSLRTFTRWTLSALFIIFIAGRSKINALPALGETFLRSLGLCAYFSHQMFANLWRGYLVAYLFFGIA
jgi:hypothetical protein